MENESDGSEEPPQTSLHTEEFSEITQDMPHSSWDQTMSTDPVGTPIIVVNDPPIDSNNANTFQILHCHHFQLMIFSVRLLTTDC